MRARSFVVEAAALAAALLLGAGAGPALGASDGRPAGSGAAFEPARRVAEDTLFQAREARRRLNFAKSLELSFEALDEPALEAEARALIREAASSAAEAEIARVQRERRRILEQLERQGRRSERTRERALSVAGALGAGAPEPAAPAAPTGSRDAALRARSAARAARRPAPAPPPEPAQPSEPPPAAVSTPGAEELEPLFEEALQAYRDGDPPGALSRLEQLLRLEPGHEAALSLRSLALAGLIRERYVTGLILYGQGRPLEAMEEWKKALELAPGEQKALRALERAQRETEGFKP